MKYKPVPEPAADVSLGDVQAAVPRVPRSTADCCTRLMDRTAIGRRDVAKTWLTFTRALGLLRETDTGWVRTDRSPTDSALPETFRENVYGVDDILAVVESSTEPVTAETVAQRVDLVPRWAGHREQDPDAMWRTRTRNILEWGVRFDLVTRHEKEPVRFTLG